VDYATPSRIPMPLSSVTVPSPSSTTVPESAPSYGHGMVPSASAPSLLPVRAVARSNVGYSHQSKQHTNNNTNSDDRSVTATPPPLSSSNVNIRPTSHQSSFHSNGGYAADEASTTGPPSSLPAIGSTPTRPRKLHQAKSAAALLKGRNARAAGTGEENDGDSGNGENNDAAPVKREWDAKDNNGMKRSKSVKYIRAHTTESEARHRDQEQRVAALSAAVHAAVHHGQHGNYSPVESPSPSPSPLSVPIRAKGAWAIGEQAAAIRNGRVSPAVVLQSRNNPAIPQRGSPSLAGRPLAPLENSPMPGPQSSSTTVPAAAAAAALVTIAPVPVPVVRRTRAPKTMVAPSLAPLVDRSQNYSNKKDPSIVDHPTWDSSPAPLEIKHSFGNKAKITYNTNTSKAETKDGTSSTTSSRAGSRAGSSSGSSNAVPKRKKQSNKVDQITPQQDHDDASYGVIASRPSSVASTTTAAVASSASVGPSLAPPSLADGLAAQQAASPSMNDGGLFPRSPITIGSPHESCARLSIISPSPSPAPTPHGFLEAAKLLPVPLPVQPIQPFRTTPSTQSPSTSKLPAPGHAHARRPSQTLSQSMNLPYPVMPNEPIPSSLVESLWRIGFHGDAPFVDAKSSPSSITAPPVASSSWSDEYQTALSSGFAAELRALAPTLSSTIIDAAIAAAHYEQKVNGTASRPHRHHTGAATSLSDSEKPWHMADYLEYAIGDSARPTMTIPQGSDDNGSTPIMPPLPLASFPPTSSTSWPLPLVMYQAEDPSVNDIFPIIPSLSSAIQDALVNDILDMNAEEGNTRYATMVPDKSILRPAPCVYPAAEITPHVYSAEGLNDWRAIVTDVRPVPTAGTTRSQILSLFEPVNWLPGGSLSLYQADGRKRTDIKQPIMARDRIGESSEGTHKIIKSLLVPHTSTVDLKLDHWEREIAYEGFDPSNGRGGHPFGKKDRDRDRDQHAHDDNNTDDSTDRNQPLHGMASPTMAPLRGPPSPSGNMLSQISRRGYDSVSVSKSGASGPSGSVAPMSIISNNQLAPPSGVLGSPQGSVSSPSGSPAVGPMRNPPFLPGSGRPSARNSGGALSSVVSVGIGGGNESHVDSIVNKLKHELAVSSIVSAVSKLAAGEHSPGPSTKAAAEGAGEAVLRSLAELLAKGGHLNGVLGNGPTPPQGSTRQASPHRAAGGGGRRSSNWTKDDRGGGGGGGGRGRSRSRSRSHSRSPSRTPSPRRRNRGRRGARSRSRSHSRSRSRTPSPSPRRNDSRNGGGRRRSNSRDNRGGSRAGSRTRRNTSKGDNTSSDMDSPTEQHTRGGGGRRASIVSADDDSDDNHRTSKLMDRKSSTASSSSVSSTGGGGGGGKSKKKGGLPPVREGRPEIHHSDEDEDQDLLPSNQKRDLFTKCRNNRYKQVEELFAGGMPVSAADQHGNQCLHMACQNGNKRMVKVCLRWGADPNCQNVS
jgi:hypothetical protein